MPRYELTKSEFQRVYEEEMLPDVNLRHDNLTVALTELEARSVFLQAAVSMMEALTEWRRDDGPSPEKLGLEPDATEQLMKAGFPWDDLVDDVEALAVIARRRCSTR